MSDEIDKTDVLTTILQICYLCLMRALTQRRQTSDIRYIPVLWAGHSNQVEGQMGSPALIT